MSISSVIVGLEKQGKLTRYVPERTTRKARRRLFMAQLMAQKFNDPKSAVNLLAGRGPINAALMTWALGDYLYDDGNGRGGFIKRLDPPPPEIWEIRITNPTAQVRVFGRFAEPDTFIATDMNTRDLLKRKGSQQWLQACSRCQSEWQSLFPSHGPFQGSVVADYVTENCDDFRL